MVTLVVSFLAHIMPNRRKPPPQTARHIEAFFAHYPEFDYDPGEPVSSEFQRLADYHKWDRRSRARREAWEGFSEAMGKQFATFYGSSIDDIDAWQALCMALNPDNVPDSISGCREVINTTHVNLVDFIDTRVNGNNIRIFATLDELRTYTKEKRKIFPKDSAKESGVLKYLLRQIF